MYSARTPGRRTARPQRDVVGLVSRGAGSAGVVPSAKRGVMRRTALLSITCTRLELRGPVRATATVRREAWSPASICICAAPSVPSGCHASCSFKRDILCSWHAGHFSLKFQNAKCANSQPQQAWADRNAGVRGADYTARSFIKGQNPFIRRIGRRLYALLVPSVLP